jgi:hypothetical protein
MTPTKEYRALLRALRRQQGFGIVFVRCSPERGSQLIEELQARSAAETL